MNELVNTLRGRAARRKGIQRVPVGPFLVDRPRSSGYHEALSYERNTSPGLKLPGPVSEYPEG